MKNAKFYVIFLVCGLLAGCSLSPSSSSAKKTGSGDPLAIYQDNLIPEYDPILKKMNTTTRYRIDLNIPDSITDITGHMTVAYTNNEKVTLDTVYFRMFPNVSGDYMTVSNLLVDGASVPVNVEYLNTALRVDLPSPLKPGKSVEISMDFNQTVPTEMGGNYGLYIYLDDILALAQFFHIVLP